jgi:NADPH:quinone reductase-like Zn-dependent oxidoreductase
LGADHGINRHREDLVTVIQSLTDNRGVDVVLDCVGGETWRQSLAALARGGRLVTCGATAGGQPQDDIAAIVDKQLKIYGSTLGSRREFYQLISFLNASRIKPIIDSVFPLCDAGNAQRYVEAAKQFGKVVLEIPD